MGYQVHPCRFPRSDHAGDSLGNQRSRLSGRLILDFVASGLGSDAPPLLLKAATQFEPLDLDLARETYLTAWMAALFAAQLAAAGDLQEVCRAARAVPPAEPPRPVDLVLDGLAMLVTDGTAAAAPTLRRAVSAFSGPELSAQD